MSEERRRYGIGVVKIPHADRDVAHDILGGRPGDRWRDVLGADTPDDDDRFPVGSHCGYVAWLTPAEAARFEAASNCRYVHEDIPAQNVSCAGTTIPSWRTWNWLGDWAYGSSILTGTTVPICIMDAGTSPACRTYKNITYAGRSVNVGTSPPPTDTIYPGVIHGCMAMGTAVPYGGTLLDAVVIDASDAALDSDVATAVNWAATQGAKVVNGSFSFAQQAMPLTHDALIAANVFDIVFYFALGNDATNTMVYPAVYGSTIPQQNIYSVASYDMSRNWLSTFSNWDSRATGVAPGEMVRSIVDPTVTATYEVEWFGTSAATPLVAGMAARLIGAGVAAKDAGAALAATTVDMGHGAFQCGGRFNFKAAAEQLGVAPARAVPVDPRVFRAQHATLHR